MLNSNASGSLGQPSIADVGGVPYVAFQQAGTGTTTEVFVDRWNGSSWIRDGGALNASSSSLATFPSIAAVGGVAYVAWSEQAAGQPQQIYVAHWSGSAWVDDEGSLNASATDDARTPAIVEIRTVPYVAWAEDNGSGGVALFVAHFSAGSWTEDVDGYTNPAFASTVVSRPALTVIGGVPHVAFQESEALVDHVYGGYVSGGEFVPLDGVLNEFSSDEAVSPAIADVSGGPYVSFTEILGSNEEQLFVKEWNGTAWALVGGALNTRTTDMKLFIDHQRRRCLVRRVVGERDRGYRGSVVDRLGPQTTDGTGSATIVQAIGGLKPKTKYSWRAIATDGPATTGVGPTVTFTTRPANGPGPTGPPGPPGKVELVTCKKVGKIETCTSKLVSGPGTEPRGYRTARSPASGPSPISPGRSRMAPPIRCTSRTSAAAPGTSTAAHSTSTRPRTPTIRRSPTSTAFPTRRGPRIQSSSATTRFTSLTSAPATLGWTTADR